MIDPQHRAARAGNADRDDQGELRKRVEHRPDRHGGLAPGREDQRVDRQEPERVIKVSQRGRRAVSDDLPELLQARALQTEAVIVRARLQGEKAVEAGGQHRDDARERRAGEAQGQGIEQKIVEQDVRRHHQEDHPGDPLRLSLQQQIVQRQIGHDKDRRAREGHAAIGLDPGADAAPAREQVGDRPQEYEAQRRCQQADAERGRHRRVIQLPGPLGIVPALLARGQHRSAGGHEGPQRAEDQIDRQAQIDRGKPRNADAARDEHAVDQRVDGAAQHGEHDREEHLPVFPPQEAVVPLQDGLVDGIDFFSRAR